MRCVIHRITFSLTMFAAVGFIGCDDVPPPVAQPQAEAPPQQMPAHQPAPAQEEKKGLIGKTTAKVVDANKALAENPNLKARDRRGLGDDPLTQSVNAYVYVRSEVSTLGMQQAIKFHQAEHGKFPDFPTFQRMMQENRIEFTEIYPWEQYGYDDKTGEIMILENLNAKAELYKANGLDPEQ